MLCVCVKTTTVLNASRNKMRCSLAYAFKRVCRGRLYYCSAIAYVTSRSYTRMNIQEENPRRKRVSLGFYKRVTFFFSTSVISFLPPYIIIACTCSVQRARSSVVNVYYFYNTNCESFCSSKVVVIVVSVPPRVYIYILCYPFLDRLQYL